MSTGASLLETVCGEYGVSSQDVYVHDLGGEERHVSPQQQGYGEATYPTRNRAQEEQVRVEIHNEPVVPKQVKTPSPQLKRKVEPVPRVTEAKGNAVKDTAVGFYDPPVVDPKSGAPAFKLEIFSIPGYTFSLHYHSSGQAYLSNYERPSNEVAFDWALNRAKIVAHRLCSGVAQERMYLFFGGQIYPLLAVKMPNGDAPAVEYLVESQPTWKIVYSLEDEKWRFILGNGQSLVFGSSHPGDGAVENCLIANNKYLGPVVVGDEQNQQKAMVWNLTQKLDRSGEPLLTFTYKQETFVPSKGGGTLTVTRATYLESITAKTGERIELSYDKKTGWEYADPHGYEPNIYQDRWHNSFLSKVSLYDAKGDLKGSAVFEYMVLFPQKTGEAPSSEWTSYLTKRLLTGVQFFDSKGFLLAEKPSFTYYGMDPAECSIEVASSGAYTYKDVNPETGAVYGALKTYKTSGGVTHTFEYDTVFLANRVQTHEPPSTTRVTRAKSYRNTVVILMSPDGDNPPVTLAVYEWDGRWRAVTIKEYEIFYKVDDVMKKFLQVGENFILFGTGPAKDSGNQGSLIALMRDRRRRATFTEQILESDMTHYLKDLTVATNMVGRVTAGEEYSPYASDKYFEIWNYNGKELVSATKGAFYEQPNCNISAISSYDNMIAYGQAFNRNYEGKLDFYHALVTRDSSGNVTRKDFKGSVKTTTMLPDKIFDPYFSVAPYYSVFLFPMSGAYNHENRLYVQSAVTQWDSLGNFKIWGGMAMDESRDHQGTALSVDMDGAATSDSCVVWVAGTTEYWEEFSVAGKMYLNSIFTVFYDAREDCMHPMILPAVPNAVATASHIVGPNAWGGLLDPSPDPYLAPYCLWSPKDMSWNPHIFYYDADDSSEAATIEKYFNEAFQIVLSFAGMLADAIVPVIGGAFVLAAGQMLQIVSDQIIEQYARRSISAGAGATGHYFIGPQDMRYFSPKKGKWEDLQTSSYSPLRPPSFDVSNVRETVGATGTTRVYGGYAGLGIAMNYGNYDFHSKYILLNGQKIKVSGTSNDHTLEGIGEYQFMTKTHDGSVMTLYATRLRDPLGPLATHPVKRVTVDDGGKIFKANFERGGLDDLGFTSPDAMNVSYPSVEAKNDSGQVEYERIFVSNATRTQTDDEYVLYINGEKQVVSKGSPYPVSMEGTPLFMAQKDASGENLQSVLYKYVVYEDDIALAHGTFQRQIYHRILSRTETVRGVSQTTTYTYNSKGQKNSETITGFQNGESESHITEWVYCWETNDFYKDQNLLTFVERVTSSVQVGDSTTIVKMIHNEYKELNPAQMTSSYLYQQYEAVDFVKAKTAPITDSTAWHLIKQVNERDSDGAILEEQGAMGEVISYLRTADSIPYATLMGSSFQKGEALYYGGESYEDQTKWKLSGGVALGKGARLNAGAYFWADTDGALTYTQGLQIKERENYTAYLRVYGESSSSKITISFKGKILSQNLKAGWQVVSFDIANGDITGVTDFTVALDASTGLDYVLLRPQGAHMSVNVYDAEKKVVMSHEGVLSTTHIYNPISKVPLTSYASTSLGTESYYSGGKTSGIIASYPGQDLILSGKTYMDAPSCHMSIDFAGEDYVALQAQDILSIPLSSDETAYAVVFDVDMQANQSVYLRRGTVSLTLVTQTQDDKLTVTVNYTDQTGTKGTNTVTYDLSSPLYPLRHIVVFHPYQLSWFMGGMALYSSRTSSPLVWGGSNLSVTGTNEGSGTLFGPVVMGENPLIACQFMDEQGRVLQNQKWTVLNNEDPYLSMVCSQNFYDDNGDFLAKSLFLPHDSTRLGEYQTTLANFAMHDSANVGEMSGDVVNYWKQIDPLNAPYAYESVSREKRPGGAIVATCSPGFYNRNYVLGSGGVDHNAIFIDRQVSIPSFYGIPSEDTGHFMRERLRKPWVGSLTSDTTTVKDTFGRVVGTVLADGSKMSTQYLYGQEGSVHSQTGQSPLSYEADDPTKYASSSATWDPLGLHHTVSFPDTGETEHITNLSGQTVFARDAEGSSGDDPVVRYHVYDDEGRLVEKGLLHMAWDTDKLMACALSETLPSGVTSLWKTKYVYDSNGRIVQDQYNNSDDSVGVVMVRDYQYNAQGAVTSVTESRWDGGLSGTRKYAYTTAYTYDALGVKLESVVYPDGQTVYFSYDVMGRLYCKSSEKDGKGTVYLRIKRYTDNGQIHCYTTGNDRHTILFYYDIQGRLVKEEVWDGGQEVFGERFAYSHGERFDARRADHRKRNKWIRGQSGGKIYLSI